MVVALGSEGRTLVSQRNWSSRLVPKEEFKWKKKCRNTLSALGIPMTGGRVPEYKIPLDRVEIDSAHGKTGGHCE